MARIIGIAALDRGGSACIRLLPDSRLFNGSRRVSRTKTLDGGCVINDGGFSDGDRTFDIAAESTRDLWDVLWSLLRSHALVTVSTSDGLFLGAVENLNEADSRIRIKIIVKEKLSS